jgi:hypothetical protein
VCLLGHALWQRAVCAGRNIVGREITMSGRAQTVIGVMPPDGSSRSMSSAAST